MNAKKKILSVALAASLAAVAVVSSSLAYFTDTDEALNTFTVGNVDITLTENKWDSSADHTLMPGVTFEKDPVITVENDSQDAWTFMEVKLNKFNSLLRLMAQYEGDQYFVYNENCQKCDGECKGHLSDAFVNMLKTNPEATEAMVAKWFKGFDTEKWQLMNGEDVIAQLEKSWNDTSVKELTLIFGYKDIQKAGTNTEALFDAVTMPSGVTTDMLEASNFNTEKADWKVDITAYGIQAAELDTLDDAYTALFN